MSAGGRERPSVQRGWLLQRLTLVAVVTATACAAAPKRPQVPSSTEPPALAVITWNMHAGAGDLPRLALDVASGRWTTGPPRDFVLLLQEAVIGAKSDPASVARARDLSFAFEPVRTDRTGAMGNAMLATRPLTGIRAIALPRERQVRAALAAMITVAGTDLFLVNAHFENRVSVWRGLLFSDGPRGRQARTLIAQLPSGPGIVGGDLNTWLGPSEPAWKTLAARFPDTPATPTAPTFRDRLVLDHLFFDLPEGWLVERHVLPDGYGSDHRPVLGVISASSSS